MGVSGVSINRYMGLVFSLSLLQAGLSEATQLDVMYGQVEAFIVLPKIFATPKASR